MANDEWEDIGPVKKSSAKYLPPMPEDNEWEDVSEDDLKEKPLSTRIGSALDVAGESALKGVGAVAGLLSPITERYEKYITGPTRAAFSELEAGHGLSAAGKAAKQQFGETPLEEYTGKQQALRQMAEKGEKDVTLSESYPSLFSDTGEGFKLQKGGLLDISKSGLRGLVRDVAQDPLLVAGPALRGAKSIAEGTKLAETAGNVGKALENAGIKLYSKIGELRTGIPEKQIETFVKEYDKVQEIIKKGDLVESADEVRRKYASALDRTRKSMNNKISSALEKPGFQVPEHDVNPIVKSLDDAASKLDIRIPEEASQVQEIKELKNVIVGDPTSGLPGLSHDGMLSTSDAYKLQKYLQSRARGAYKKEGQLFFSGDQTQRASKNAASKVREIVNSASPEIKEANEQLSKLHVLEKRINKNLISEGKPEAGLISAGAGSNKRNLKNLEILSDLTGIDAITDAEILSSAKAFSRTGLSPVDVTGKSVLRSGLGYLTGTAAGGPVGGLVGAAATSPMALKGEVGAAKALSKGIRKIPRKKELIKAGQVKQASDLNE